MTYLNRQSTIVVSLMFLFGILGWFFHQEYLELILGYFENVTFQLTSLLGLPNTFIFCWALGILPILIYGSNLFARNNQLGKRVITAVITLLTGFAFLFARILYINSFTGADARFPGIHLSIALESLDTEHYLGSGFIVGAIISSLIFRLIPKQN